VGRIGEAFARAKRDPGGLVIPYLTGGYPDLEKSEQLLCALAEAGAEVIELGIPFSDPIADGVTIQEATYIALRSGATPIKVLKLAERVTGRYDVSMIILSYLNPIIRIGISRFMEEASSRGVSGLIVPDLPLEEAGLVKSCAERFNVSLILLAAPTTNDERLARIIELSDDFTYLVSLKGVTGARDRIPETAASLVRRAKRLRPDKYVAVGFGISTPTQAAQLIEEGADGIIVGSKLISLIMENPGREFEALNSFFSSFIDGIRQSAQS